MKHKLIRYACLVMLLAIIATVCLGYVNSKKGMFIDEIYSFGLSNNHDGAYVSSVIGGSLEDKTLTRQDLLDYVVVNEGEEFDFKAVYNNQAEDVHPPLYYWLFHIVYSFFPNSFDMQPAYVLHLAIFTACLVLLYALLQQLFKSSVVALAGVAMYGLSLLGLNTMLMLRMYVLMTTFTVLLALLIAKLMHEKKPWLYILVALTVFAGVMTQYYFVFYAFFLCGFYVFYCLFKKDFKATAIFAASAFAGIALLLICFPACITQLFADKLVSGGNALENLSDSSQYLDRILYFYKEVRHGTKAAIMVGLALIPVLLVFTKKLVFAFKAKKIKLDALLFIVPAFITLVLVALISPVKDQRYVYNLIPFFIIAVCLLIHALEVSTEDIKLFGILKWAALVCLVLFSVWFARHSVPLYQYPEHEDYNLMLSAHSDAPCVYFTDDKFEPITESLVQLLIFEDVFCTSSPESEKLDAYLENFEGDKCIVFVDVNEFWSSGFDSEEMLSRFMESSDFSSYEHLYSYNLSQTYLLSK